MVLLSLLLLGALAEEFTQTPQRKRRFRLQLTKKEASGLVNIGSARGKQIGSDFDIFRF